MDVQPNLNIATSVAEAMLKTNVDKVERVTLGAQNFVYFVTVGQDEFVLRMTLPQWVDIYRGALRTQSFLGQYDVPVIPCLFTDFTQQYSIFPAALMRRAPGTDLINSYNHLSKDQLVQLAYKVAAVHARTYAAPPSARYGFCVPGEVPPFPSWVDFLSSQWSSRIAKLGRDDTATVGLLKRARDIGLRLIKDAPGVCGTPFIWDAADRNVIIHNGCVTGIIDTDNLCYGDPVLTVALMSAICRQEGYSDVYAQTWISTFTHDLYAQVRFDAYLLYWTAHLLTSPGVQSSNGNVVQNRRNILLEILDSLIIRSNL